MSLKTVSCVVLPILRLTTSTSRNQHCNSIFFKKITNCFTLCNSTQRIRFLCTKTINQDKKPDSNEPQLVYTGILTPQMRSVKIFSLLTSITGIVAQPVLYNKIVGTGNIPIMVAAFSFVGFFTLGTPFLLHFITKKYITALYYKPSTKSYVANTLNLFNMKKELEFTPDDVKVPDVTGMFTTFLIKDKPLFLDPRLFEDPSHYGKIMGYDKPLDLKLYQTSSNEKKP